MGAETASEADARRSSVLADLATAPNLLSVSRIFGVLVAASLYLYGFRGAGLALGLAAGLTDFLDGYLARRLDQKTELGAILDRLSDMVLETTAFVCIVYFRFMSPVFCFLYLLRELAVVSARMDVARRGGTIPTIFLGKLKTSFLGFSFLLLFGVHAGLISEPGVADVAWRVGYGGVIAGLVISYISGAQYLQVFARHYDGR